MLHKIDRLINSIIVCQLACAGEMLGTAIYVVYCNHMGLTAQATRMTQLLVYDAIASVILFTIAYGYAWYMGQREKIMGE